MHLDDNCFSLYEKLSNFQSENARGTLFQQCKKPASYSVIQKASIQSSIVSVDWIVIRNRFKEALYDVIHMADFRSKRRFDPKPPHYVMNKLTIHRVLELFC